MSYQEVEHAIEVSLTLTPPCTLLSLLPHPHLGLDGVPGGGTRRGGKSHPHPPCTLTLTLTSPCTLT